MFVAMIINRILVLIVAMFLDAVLGDPRNIWHPVCAIGKLISFFEAKLWKWFRIDDARNEDVKQKRLAGVLLVVLVLVCTLVPCWLLLFLAGKFSWYLATFFECVMCYQLLAMKSLKTESMKVYAALSRNDLPQARKDVSMIVGRDTAHLDEAGVTRAAVETVAENTSDGIVAPLFYMMLFGALGGFFYKAINTMDSMVGYKNDKYLYFGRAAAKLDDVVNYIPARLSGLFMVLAAGCLGLSMQDAWDIMRRDRANHASPNSAWTEAACAGALGVELAGNAYYFGKLYEKPTIGDAKRSIEAKDIKRANDLMYGTCILALFIFVTVLANIAGWYYYFS